MKINLFGFSNLGHDLYRDAKDRGYEIRVCASDREEKLHDDPDIVINTRGGCAGGDFVDDAFTTLWRLNIIDNVKYCERWPKAKVIAFSSNSAMEPWRTPYASIKSSMEDLVLEYRNFEFIRVGNLYGTYKKELTFPGKILMNRPDNLPDNPIVPIPTDWLAQRFWHGFSGNQLYPTGVTTPRLWAEAILGVEIKSSGLSSDRNQDWWFHGRSGVNWLKLWDERKHWFGGHDGSMQDMRERSPSCS